MRVLIVGCGYVGLALGEALGRLGHEVKGIRRTETLASELEARGIEPLILDITRPDVLAKATNDYEWVVNCVSSSHGGLADYRAVYLEGNRNLVNWLSGSTVEKFVYTSSTSVYGQTDGATVTEKSETLPREETGKILVATEKLLVDSFHRIQFPSIILRVAGIYGPNRGYWFKQLVKGEARIENHGARIINMIHRDDVVGAIIAALHRGKPGEVYNAVDDQSVTQVEFLTWLAKRIGRELPPGQAGNSHGKPKRGLTNKRVSNEKLKKELGYQFKYPTFKEGYVAEVASPP